MSVSQQLQAVVSAAVVLEQSLVDQSARAAGLSSQVDRLTVENAALRQQLAAAATPPVPLPPPTTSPEETSPETGGLPAAAVTQWGFAANDQDPAAAFAPALTRLKADGGTWLRLWHSSFGPINGATVAIINAAAERGIRVILCVQPKDTRATNLGVPDFATFVAKNSATLKKLAFVEVGNELNLATYRPDDLGGGLDWHGPYVDRWLRPMSAALATIGVKTLCTSVTDTYHPQNYAPQYDALLAAGARDCCDGVAVHLYFLPQFLRTLPAIVADLTAKWAKPIHVTECNVLTKGLTVPQWQERFPQYVAALRASGVAGVQFYRGFAKPNGKWGWPVLFDNRGTPTDAYEVLRAAMTA